MEQLRKNTTVWWIAGALLYLGFVVPAIRYTFVADAIPWYADGSMLRRPHGADSLRSRGRGALTEITYWDMKLRPASAADKVVCCPERGPRIGSAVIRGTLWSTTVGTSFISSDSKWANNAAASTADWAKGVRTYVITDALQNLAHPSGSGADKAVPLIVIDASQIVRVRNYAAMTTAAFALKFGAAVLLLLLGFFTSSAPPEKALRTRRLYKTMAIAATVIFVGSLCLRAVLGPRYIARMTMLYYQTSPEEARRRAAKTARQIVRLLDTHQSPEALQRSMKVETMPKWDMVRAEFAPDPHQCEYYGDRVASGIQSAYALAVAKPNPDIPKRLFGVQLMAAERPLVILEPPRRQPLAIAMLSAFVPTGWLALAAILFLLGLGIGGIVAQRRPPD